TVYKRPKVALIANGDELVKPGSELKSGQIISSNAYALSALIKAWGAEPVDAGISIDDPAAIRQQIHECGDVDLFVPVGGASVGDRDYMRTVFAEMGYTKIFEKVAVKPGKPVWFGQMDSALVLGLPGNPASALVCAQIFLKPLLFALLGDQAPANTPHFARTTTSLNAPGWRTSFIRAFAYIDQSGCVHVTRADNQDSSLLTPFRNSNCFIRQDADTASIAAGELVEIVPIKPI
ncbi:MAG TPA: molybdopterin molybdenumtransferase MoeA, partial [Hellea balneolensis]|nr:molybdopterin molybdenumtransferase MoeA [Hellea balneolensis]